MRLLPLALSLGFLRSIASAPTQDLAQAVTSSSSSLIPGTISIPFKKQERIKGLQSKSKRADQLGQIPLSDIADYTYYSIIEIGSQEFTLQLDTGSSLTIVYGSDFFSPSNKDLNQDIPKTKTFDPSKSSTFSRVENNSVTYNYLADYFRADIVQDTITFGGYEIGNAAFALASSGNASFGGGDGLIGLSFSPLNNYNGSAQAFYTLPLVETLWHLGALKSPLFSFNMFTQNFNPLLDSPSEDSPPPTPGGELLLGGVNDSLFEGDIAYSPLVVDSGWTTEYPSSWRTTVEGVIINGELLPNSRFDALFDTGTPSSQLPQSILNNLFAGINATKYPTYITPGSYGTQYSFECPDDFPQFTYSLMFGGRQFDLAFADLIEYRYSTEEGKVICQLTQTSEADNEPDKFVIGDDMLKAFYTVYRFDPPSIGLAKLSQKVTSSLNPIPADLKHISIDSSDPLPLTELELSIGSPTRPVSYTPVPYPTAETFSSFENETRYWDPRTHTLPREPTLLGTAAPIPSPTFTSQATGTENGNGDANSSSISHQIASTAVVILLGLLLPLLVL